MSEKIERFGSAFAPGDKVMQIENDYDREVFNGDLGRIRRIDQTEGFLIAEFDGREVEYPFGELDALVPAYATTIHKSQGSEYPAVVITLATQHYTMLARNRTAARPAFSLAPLPAPARSIPRQTSRPVACGRNQSDQSFGAAAHLLGNPTQQHSVWKIHPSWGLLLKLRANNRRAFVHPGEPGEDIGWRLTLGRRNGHGFGQ
jgi:ATP-dependent exoDNAse (exonuclease V), alpha subunit - helicase superfamily I member